MGASPLTNHSSILRLCVAVLLSAFLAAAQDLPAKPQAEADERLSLSKPLRLTWTYDTSDLGGFSSATSQDNLYIPYGSGEIAALNVSTGQLRWKSEVGGQLSASPAADQQGVYVASEVPRVDGGAESKAGGVIRLLGVQSGVTVWGRATSAPVRGSLSVSATALFAALEDGRILALDKPTGEILWAWQNDAPFFSRPLLISDTLYWGDESSQIFSVDGKTGQTLWRYRTLAGIRSQPVAVNGKLIFACSDNYVYALDVHAGGLLWRVKTGSGVQALAAGGGRIFVAALDNFAYCVSAVDGKRLWKRRMPGRVSAKPVVSEGGVLFAPLSGEECIVLNPDNGKKINSVRVGPDNNVVAPPLVAGGLLLVTTRQGVLAYSSATIKGR